MAAKDINKALLTGRLGQEPKIYETNTGGKIANLSLASKEVWKNKTTGMSEEKTMAYNRLL